ncbi:polysaccharide deacetylase family protein [Actinomadura spongiicola]|uniref:polysaccharide deacetylase family protein n=1 Tax=Actinomadura spongiicola TaxID=2303421 RepID=UPI0011C13EB8|nr:polysaccharide deacetylase family protein [Actinomadura spongiicola]
MSEVVVLVGFDCDCPRIQYGVSGGQEHLHHTVLGVMERITDLLLRAGAGHTYFLNGGFLELARHLGTEARLAAVLDADPVEAGDHGYSHRPYVPVAGRPDYRPLDVTEIELELQLTRRLLERVCPRPAVGVRTPLGHPGGLREHDTITESLKRQGVRYVSSDLRDPDSRPHAALVDGSGAARQPYRYRNGLLEMPSHGHHDSHFERAARAAPDRADVRRQAYEHYRRLIEDAATLAVGRDHPVYVGLVLHPSSIAWYDPDCRVLDRLVGVGGGDGPVPVTFMSYRAGAEHSARRRTTPHPTRP